MVTVPLELRSAEETATVSSEGLTKVTWRELPFHVIVELARKFEPVMVNVKPFAPAGALLGLLFLIELQAYP
jgi:hypothetical protein